MVSRLSSSAIQCGRPSEKHDTKKNNSNLVLACRAGHDLRLRKMSIIRGRPPNRDDELVAAAVEVVAVAEEKEELTAAFDDPTCGADVLL